MGSRSVRGGVRTETKVVYRGIWLKENIPSMTISYQILAVIRRGRGDEKRAAMESLLKV